MTSNNPLAVNIVAAARHTLAEGRERIEHCVAKTRASAEKFLKAI